MSTTIQPIHQAAVALSEVQEKIIAIRNQNVILDSDVATLYGVETREVNQAVKNNPAKFPEGFIFELQNAEKQHVVKNFDRFNKLKHSTVLPDAFTEQGLYMLATILKSEKATETTIAIVQAFAKLRELSQLAADMVSAPEDTKKQTSFMQKTNELLSSIITNDLKTTSTETTFEFNLMSAVKIKHTIKRGK